MPRCITCNYCSETDDPRTVSFNWSDEDHGYTCTDCGEGIAEASYYSEGDLDDGELDTFQSDDILGPDAVLDKQRLDPSTGEDE